MKRAIAGYICCNYIAIDFSFDIYGNPIVNKVMHDSIFGYSMQILIQIVTVI